MRGYSTSGSKLYKMCTELRVCWLLLSLLAIIQGKDINYIVILFCCISLKKIGTMVVNSDQSDCSIVGVRCLFIIQYLYNLLIKLNGK